MPSITPAILTSRREHFSELTEKLSFAPRIHVDFADGDFVKGRTLDLQDCVLPHRDIDWVAHLMLADGPERIEEAVDRGFDEIIIHLETIALVGTKEEIQRITETWQRITFAINPRTSLSPYRPFLKYIGKLLFLTVEPGRQGGQWHPEVLERALAIGQAYPHLDIGLDGGINRTTLPEAQKTGAHEYVVGSAIVKATDPRAAYEELTTLVTETQ